LIQTSNDNIVEDIKKVLQLPADYNAFDIDVVMHINSVFSTLQQLGVGPAEEFSIEDGTETWGEFFARAPGTKKINAVKSYMYLRCRVLFDPPTTSFALDSMDKQIKELEWRLNVQAEGTV